MNDAGYASLEFSQTFLESFASREFAAAERASFLKALHLLDTNELHAFERGVRAAEARLDVVETGREG